MRFKFMGLGIVCASMFFVSCGNTSSPNVSSDVGSSDAGVADEPLVADDDYKLINGTVADQSLYPASVQVTSGGGSCTGTVVGEKAMIIASHCVEQGATATFTAAGKRYSSVCSRASLYRRGVDHDLAICRTSEVVTGIEYENVNVQPGLVKPGDKLLLTGYGCRTVGGQDQADGKYRTGETTVMQMPNIPYSYDIVTENGGALCFGDSGGPAFYSATGDPKDRVVVSVNSKGNIQNVSYLTDTSTQASIDFLKLWREYYSLKVCGIDEDATGCRNSTAVPSEPTDPGFHAGRISQECIDVEKNSALIRLHSCILDANTDANACQQAENEVYTCLDTKPW